MNEDKKDGIVTMIQQTPESFRIRFRTWFSLVESSVRTGAGTAREFGSTDCDYDKWNISVVVCNTDVPP